MTIMIIIRASNDTHIVRRIQTIAILLGRESRGERLGEYETFNWLPFM